MPSTLCRRQGGMIICDDHFVSDDGLLKLAFTDAEIHGISLEKARLCFPPSL